LETTATKVGAGGQRCRFRGIFGQIAVQAAATPGEIGQRKIAAGVASGLGIA